MTRWRRAVRMIGLAMLLMVAAALAVVYTIPVPISNNLPIEANTRLCERILGAKRVLFVGAHPDDIEFYCGALVFMLRHRGADVTFAIGTRGGKGRSGTAKARIETLRTQHQYDAARILGGVKVILFDHPDKDLPRHIPDFAGDLKAVIANDSPDLVLSWDPDCIYNPHPDHQAAAEAARIACPVSKLCYYGTRKPNVWLGFGEDVFRVNLKSLKAHRTETPWYYFILARRFLTKKLRGEGAKIKCEYAETFRLPLIAR